MGDAALTRYSDKGLSDKLGRVMRRKDGAQLDIAREKGNLRRAKRLQFSRASPAAATAAAAAPSLRGINP